tara:strand:- start:5735 stop:7735 length:2001 start_codon:yes stop_codon:yes gene_type:complete
MPNIRKSFSFRDGVQVDDDDFIVRGNLVGIGTTVPTERLDVKGNIAVAGLVTTTELNVTGVSTFAEVKLGTGINMNSSGVITATSFKGDGSTLSNLPTSQWTDVNIGAGVTSIYNSGSVGVGTTDPVYQFQVGKNPDNSTGVGIDSTGNINATGVVTATTFSGNLTGNVTGDITGDITASTLNATGISTFNDDAKFIGTSHNAQWDKSANSLKFAGNAHVLFGSTNLLELRGDWNTGSSILNSSGTLYLDSVNDVRLRTGTIKDALRAYAGGSVELYYGSTPTKVLSTSGVGVTITSQLDTTNLSISGVSTFTGVVNANGQVKVGTGGTAFTTLATGQAGVGTATPTTDFQVRKSNGSKIEVVADSGVAQVSIGQTVGAGSSVGYIRYGSTNKTLEVINNDTGSLNMVLHNGPAGLSTGRFGWKYGQTNNELMSLTYDGKLGINQTVPTNTLHVVGTSTVTGNAWVGGNLDVRGSISGTFNWPSILTGTNLNNTSGISTFYNVNITNKVGLTSALPTTDLDGKGKKALLGGIGINTDTVGLYGNELLVQGNAAFSSTVGFGTTAPNPDIIGSTGAIQVHNNDIVIRNGGINLDGTSKSFVGIGTTMTRAVVDFSMVGGIGTVGYMLPPVITTANQVGLQTVFGGVVYNSTTNKLQCYTPTGWQDLF